MRSAIWCNTSVVIILGLSYGAANGQPTEDWTVPRSLPGLENVLRITSRFYTGGEPKGDLAFSTLRNLGIRVVVSVDGARPDVERAARLGMRYVHIPIGYDGVGPEAQAALTRLVREFQGPFYIHCHHGQHRGPAAAAVAALACQAIDHSTARRILEVAGTSRAYQGLWRAVERFKPLPLDAPLPELHSIAPVPSLAAAMATLDRHFDLLKQLEKNRWEPLADHPDVTADQEALLLAEALHEAKRRWSEQRNATAMPDFGRQLDRAESLARMVRQAILDQKLAEATDQLGRLQQSCIQCHRQYRDGP